MQYSPVFFQLVCDSDLVQFIRLLFVWRRDWSPPLLLTCVYMYFLRGLLQSKFLHARLRQSPPCLVLCCCSVYTVCTLPETDFLQAVYVSRIIFSLSLISQVINGLMSRDDRQTAVRTPLGHIPTGSGNALCVSLLYQNQWVWLIQRGFLLWFYVTCFLFVLGSIICVLPFFSIDTLNCRILLCERKFMKKELTVICIESGHTIYKVI